MAEAVFQSGIEFLPEFGVFAAEADHLGAQLDNHALKNWNIFGQRVSREQARGVHASFNTAPHGR